jgi:hypothetical protein
MNTENLKMKTKIYEVYLIPISEFNDEICNLPKSNIHEVQSMDINFFRIMQENQEVIKLETKLLENKLETKIS